MCGRMTLATPAGAVADEFGLDEPPPLPGPRYNIAPAQEVLAIFEGKEARLVRWAGEQPNTRSERPLSKFRRSVVVADGFYEWRAGRPWLYYRRDRRPFAIGAVFPVAGGVSLLTMEANDLVRPVHERMPVILGPRDWRRWLEDGTLRPIEPDALAGHRVGPRVSDARNEGPDLIAPCREATLFDLE